MSFDKEFEKRQSFVDSFLTPKKRLVIDGSMKLLQMWVEAVEAGQLWATPAEVEKTKASIEKHRIALSSSLSPEDIRNN